MQGNVTLSIRNKVGYIEFFHPNKNAMPSGVLTQLQDVIHEAGNNDDVKVIVLQSGGDRAFCAGASFNELIAIDDAETGKHFFSGFANVINASKFLGSLFNTL